MTFLSPCQNGSAKLYGFPRELLDQSDKKRLDYFKNSDVTVMHRSLVAAYDSVHRAVYEPLECFYLHGYGSFGCREIDVTALAQQENS